MIKLTRTSAPTELTSDLVGTLTKRHRETGEDVWNRTSIRNALMAMSNNKCCYCECKIDEESKYLEVDHFRPKSLFQDLVVVWSNLLPACKHCNGCKSHSDTELYPIIDPSVHDPKDYLQLKGYRLHPRDLCQLGKETIITLDLNNRERLVNKRFEIGDKIEERLVELYEDLEELIDLSDGPAKTRKQNRICKTINNLLIEAQPTREYSATAATTIVSSRYYKLIRAGLQQFGLWSQKLQAMDQVATDCSLE